MKDARRRLALALALVAVAVVTAAVVIARRGPPAAVTGPSGAGDGGLTDGPAVDADR